MNKTGLTEEQIREIVKEEISKRLPEIPYLPCDLFGMADNKTHPEIKS